MRLASKPATFAVSICVLLTIGTALSSCDSSRNGEHGVLVAPTCPPVRVGAKVLSAGLFVDQRGAETIGKVVFQRLESFDPLSKGEGRVVAVDYGQVWKVIRWKGKHSLGGIVLLSKQVRRRRFEH
jgi:hypothetical protein